MGTKEKALLHKVYMGIAEYKRTLTQSRYFDYILSTAQDYSGKTKEKYIRYSNNMPQKYIEYYWEKTNKEEIKAHLRNWCEYVKSDQTEIQNRILGVLREDGHNDIADRLDVLRKKKDAKDTEFYYQLFRYCLTGECSSDTEDKNDRERALLEFNEMILMQYGISGNSGKQVIMQMAGAGTDNPYILFEAAEIEYMKNYGVRDGRSDESEHYLDRAYEYYKKASDIGFPLADWSLGYLAQKCYEKPWDVKAYNGMSGDEKIRTAIEYYLKAEKEGCSKAFNSLGNIAAHHNIKPELKQGLRSAKDYYREAAIRNNVFGMFNYAELLEAELRTCVMNGASFHHGTGSEAANKGKEMLEYFKKSADLGHPNACYRYALYCGHLTDEKTIPARQFLKMKEDKVSAIKYLRKAILHHEETLYYDACIFLSDYIVTDTKLFINKNKELRQARDYISTADEELVKQGAANQRQKEQVERLKQMLKL